LAVGDEALYFLRGYGKDVFPGVPIVSWAGRDLVENWGAGPPVTGVLEPETTDQLRRFVGFIQTLQPDLRHVFVVSGASAGDRRRAEDAREALRVDESGIAFTYLEAMPLEDVQRALTQLPPQSAVLFMSMFEDGAGRILLTREVLTDITPATNAPVYALSSVHLGSGIVGGLLINQQNMAREAA
jgi:hypothetical protein